MPFDCWAVFHGKDVPQFIYLLMHFWARSSLWFLVLFLYKVLLAYSRVQSRTYCLWLSLPLRGQIGEVFTETVWPSKAKIVTIWLLIENVCRSLVRSILIRWCSCQNLFWYILKHCFGGYNFFLQCFTGLSILFKALLVSPVLWQILITAERLGRDGQSWGWKPLFPGVCMSPWSVNAAILISTFFFVLLRRMSPCWY